MQDASMVLKGEMSMVNVLHLFNPDVTTVLNELTNKRDESPQFFMQSPLIVDCNSIEEGAEIDFHALYQGIKALSFVPLGLRHLNNRDVAAVAVEAGWSILRDSIAKGSVTPETEKVDVIEALTEIEEATTSSVSADDDAASQELVVPEPEFGNESASPLVVHRPIRSGQQVYSPDGDIVVLSQTSAGSEVLAHGSIHVYGKLSGRVLAGVNGDRSARIFCQSLDAELISIAGSYQLLDETNTPLKGQPAMIYLINGKLKIEPLG